MQLFTGLVHLQNNELSGNRTCGLLFLKFPYDTETFLLRKLIMAEGPMKDCRNLENHFTLLRFLLRRLFLSRLWLSMKRENKFHSRHQSKEVNTFLFRLLHHRLIAASFVNDLRSLRTIKAVFVRKEGFDAACVLKDERIEVGYTGFQTFSDLDVGET